MKNESKTKKNVKLIHKGLVAWKKMKNTDKEIKENYLILN